MQSLSLDSLKNVIMAVGSPIIVSKGGSGQILFLNPPAEELIGSTQNDLYLKPCSELFDSSSSKKVMSALSILERKDLSQRIRETDLQLVRKSGRRAQVALSAKSVLLENELVVLLSLEDRTEIKAAHAQHSKLIEENIILSKVAELGQISAGVAHELNNPLAILMGRLENLIEAKPLEPSLQLSLESCLKSAHRMRLILKSMLDKMRGGQAKKEAFDVGLILAAVLRSHQTELASIGIQVEVPEVSCWVDGDPVFTEQILTNLVSNSIYALKESAHADKKIRFSCERRSGAFHLCIHNNGPAISSEMQEDIFKPFKSNKPRGSGTGLGLYISRNMMLSQGGRLMLAQSDDVETSFLLEFKIATASSAAG